MDKRTIAEATAIPFDEIDDAYDELIKLGIIVTTTDAFQDLSIAPHHTRMLSKSVTDMLPNDVLSCGPFPVNNLVIERAEREFPEERDTRAFLYSMARLCFEKTGSSDLGGYKFSADDESMASLFLDTKTYDIDSPRKFENHSWFFPTGETLNNYNRDVEEENRLSSVSELWSTLVSYGEKLESSKAEDRPENLSYYPSYLLEEWSKFIPSVLLETIHNLYIESSKGLEWKVFQSKEEIFSIIEKAIELYDESNLEHESDYSIDRSVLIKEIFEYNGFFYSNELEIIYNQLIELKFIDENEDGNISVVHDEIHCNFKFPKGWKRRYEKYIVTGSVLFGYLKLSEIVK